MISLGGRFFPVGGTVLDFCHNEMKHLRCASQRTLPVPGAVVAGTVRVGFNSSGRSHWRRDISQSKS